MIAPFPKIQAVGGRFTTKLFDSEVEVTEKIDGSQFDFGLINGELHMRSKGRIIVPGNEDAMFRIAVESAQNRVGAMPDNTIFYCEYLNKPKHNTIKYDNVPLNNLVLFGASEYRSGEFLGPDYLDKISGILNIDRAPILFRGKVDSISQLVELLETESYLGGSKIEGFVIKNYNETGISGDEVFRILSAKFVSDAFKEKNGGNRVKAKGSNKWDAFKGSFNTTARWEKAYQHLRDNGDLLHDPRDIGPLMKEVNLDIEDEHKAEILSFLWKEFGKDIFRAATNGLPAWYKTKLLEGAIGDG